MKKNVSELERPWAKREKNELMKYVNIKKESNSEKKKEIPTRKIIHKSLFFFLIFLSNRNYVQPLRHEKTEIFSNFTNDVLWFEKRKKNREKNK